MSRQEELERTLLTAGTRIYDLETIIRRMVETFTDEESWIEFLLVTERRIREAENTRQRFIEIAESRRPRLKQETLAALYELVKAMEGEQTAMKVDGYLTDAE